jgi:GNAT superfamily N-acetyltransferase
MGHAPRSRRAFLADDDCGRACGIAGVLREAQRDDVASLISMWVEPEHRRRGVGRALVSAVVRWCRDNDVTDLHLSATEPNPGAAALYERCGFAPTGRRQALPSNSSLDEVEMSLPCDRFSEVASSAG